MTECLVTFLPYNRSIAVEQGTSLLQAALAADIPLEHACGGLCSCCSCHIVIEEGQEGLSLPSEEEKERLQELCPTAENIRLACQTSVEGKNLTITIPSVFFEL